MKQFGILFVAGVVALATAASAPAQSRDSQGRPPVRQTRQAVQHGRPPAQHGRPPVRQTRQAVQRGRPPIRQTRPPERRIQTGHGVHRRPIRRPIVRQHRQIGHLNAPIGAVYVAPQMSAWRLQDGCYPVAAWRSDARSHVAWRRRRHAYFGRPSFVVHGVRYRRFVVWRDGRECYVYRPG